MTKKIKPQRTQRRIQRYGKGVSVTSVLSVVFEPILENIKKSPNLRLFNFFRIKWIIAKKINRRGRGGSQRVVVSLCVPLRSLRFFRIVPENNKKSPNFAE
jgi:hypothetical protein